MIYRIYSKLALYYFKIKGMLFYRFFFKSFGKGSYIYSPLIITPSNIYIGSNVGIRNNARIEGVRKYGEQVFSPSIIIRDNVRIEQNIHLTCANKIFIGENTSIASNVTITDINHQYEDITLPVELQNLDVMPVFIGEDSKIYNNTVILPGVTIGKHCIIGANSVVNINIPDYCVAVGSPVIIVKRFNIITKRWNKTDKYGNFLDIK